MGIVSFFSGFLLALLGTSALALVVLIWLLPGLIASRRKHPKRIAIWLITVFLGFSAVGWVIALTWAIFGPLEEVAPEAAKPHLPLPTATIKKGRRFFWQKRKLNEQQQ